MRDRRGKRDLPIYRFIVPLGGHHFGGEIVRRTAERPRNVGHLLGKPEISNFNVSVAIKEEIFGLEIAIDDVLGVEVFQGKCDFGGIELGYGIGEALDTSVSVAPAAPTARAANHPGDGGATHLRLAEQAEQFSALDKVHDHVEVLRVLEGAPERD